MPTKDEIKLNFEDGDTPTETHFSELIDAVFDQGVDFSEKQIGLDPRWLSGVAPTLGGTSAYSAEVNENETFDYVGNSLDITFNNAPNFIFTGFDIASAGWQAGEAVSVNFEVHSSITKTATVHIQQSSTTIVQKNIELVSDQITTFNIQVVPTSNAVLSVRFFSDFTGLLKFGRFAMSLGSNESLELPGDLFDVTALNASANTEKEIVKKSLFDNPRWVRDFTNVSFQQNSNIQIRSIETDAQDVFGYDGNYLQQSSPSQSNFFFRITNVEEIRNDPVVVETGKVTIELELQTPTPFTFSLIQIFYNEGGGEISGPNDAGYAISEIPKKLVLTTTFANVSLLSALRIRFFKSAAPMPAFNIGRMNIYGGDAVGKIEFIRDIEKAENYQNFELSNGSSTIPIDAWGDSLLNLHSTNNWLGNNTGREVEYNNHGGESSTQIKERLFLQPPSTNTHIIWCGRNHFGVDNVDIVLKDLQEIVDYIGHERYLMVGVSRTSTEVNPSSGYDLHLDYERRMARQYGDKFLSLMGPLIENYPYGVTSINTDFVQPSLGSNVDVNVDDATNINTSSQVRIGYKSTADLYTVISKSGNTLTLRLDSADRIAVGQTVGDYLTDGPSGAFTASSWPIVIQALDYTNYFQDIPPDGYRSDSVHLNTPASEQVALLIQRRLEHLGY